MKKWAAFLLGVVLSLNKRLCHLLTRSGQAIEWIRFVRFVYAPRPSDIFIVTYPRSGTTWMQMILYQLTHDDDELRFAHINQVIPWFEHLSWAGARIEALPGRRIFKTHLPCDGGFRTIPKGACRYIYVAREGEDVALSYYHFYRSHLGFRGTFDEFFPLFLQGRVQYGSWFRHVAGWATRQNDPDVLFLNYEDVRADLPGAVRRIADFCEIPLDAQKLPGILERCSFSYMKRHEAKFDPMTALMLEQGVDHAGKFLRRGAVGEGRSELTPEQRARFAEQLSAHQTRLAPSVVPAGVRQSDAP